MLDPADTGLSESQAQPEAASSEPASPAAESPPSGLSETQSLLREGLTARAEARKQRSALKDGEPKGTPADDEPADKATSPEAVKSEEQQQPEPAGDGKGRRAKAAERNAQTIEELRVENERLKQTQQEQVAAAAKAQRDAEDAAAKLKADQEAYERTAHTLIGREDEYHRRLNAPAESLTPAQRQELEDWKVNRSQLAPISRYYQSQALQQADQRVKQVEAGFLQWVGNGLDAVKAEPGVDAAFVEAQADLGAIGKHLIEVGMKRRDAEVADLKAQLAEANANVQAASHDRLGNARRAEMGGRSAGPQAQTPDDDASPREMIAYALAQRQRQSRAARTA